MFWREGGQGIPIVFRSQSSGLSEQRLEFREDVLDRIKVGAVGRKMKQLSAGGLSAAEIVHPDDIARFQFQDKILIDIGLESRAVDRPVDDHRRNHAGQPKLRGEGRRFPWP